LHVCSYWESSEGRSSFSEEKEAKRLLSIWGECKWIEVFWFFFSKKNILLRLRVQGGGQEGERSVIGPLG
jgi:hypothetical protein